jgi:peptidoglycan/LPS O-acetylase OafA/YrhL
VSSELLLLNTNQPSSKRYMQIDGLRTLFCLAIVLYHYCIRYFELFHGVANSYSFLPDAMVFVGGFFILSGFFTSINKLKCFWSKRFWTLYVPYLFAITITFFFVYYCNNFVNLSFADYGASILVFPTFISQWKLVDGALWYVCKLFVAYLLVSISYLIGKLFKNDLASLVCNFVWLILCFTSCFVSPASIVSKFFLVIFDSRLILYFLGVFMRSFILKFTSNLGNQLKANLTTPFFIISLLFSFAFFAIKYRPANLPYFLIIFLLICLSITGKIKLFDSKMFHTFGKSSYWCYLLHEYIGYLIIAPFDNNGLYWVGLSLALLYAFSSGVLFSLSCEKIKSFMVKHGDLQR